jgi:hypothetical protein
VTPMKRIILIRHHILVEDMSGRVELKASAVSVEDAEWLAGSLAAWHKVPLDRSDESIVAIVRGAR